jgi:hypothetical protein
MQDDRRFAPLNHLLTPEGEPLLRRDRDYITVWGFWNGPDEMLADDDTRRYKAMNTEKAHQSGLIDPTMLDNLVSLKNRHLASQGFEDLRPKPEHLLVSFDHNGEMLRDADGQPDIRLCNFELVRQHRVAATD